MRAACRLATSWISRSSDLASRPINHTIVFGETHPRDLDRGGADQHPPGGRLVSVASSVRVLPLAGASLGDSQAAAFRRVQLKLASLAYAGIRRGADAHPALVSTSLAHLCASALAYYQELGGRIPVPETIAPTPEAQVAVTGLQIRAVAYDASRVGSDACVEFARDALADLLRAAVVYCEALPGATPDEGRARRAADDSLRLDP